MESLLSRNTRYNKERNLNQEVADLRLMTKDAISLKSGDLSEKTKIIRWVYNYRGNNSFMKCMKAKARKYGYKNLSEKQKNAIDNCYYRAAYSPLKSRKTQDNEVDLIYKNRIKK